MLGATPVQEMFQGPQAMQFHIDEVDVSALANHVLANVGLITLKLFAFEPSQEIVQIGMVTQVTQQGDVLMRDVFNPLE